jgi:tRNA-specific 2-thiouridylase
MAKIDKTLCFSKKVIKTMDYIYDNIQSKIRISELAKKIDIPFEVIDCANEFEDFVLKYFRSELGLGRTPNPCVECNRHLKFAALFGKAEELGCELVVTGHYAKVEFDEKRGRYLLKKADDLSKDQSYVLYALTQSQLSRACFPLGEFSKDTVREIAEQNSFINADKGDSQDICFVKNCSYSEFIENYTKKKYPEGNFVDADGKILGRHKGIIRYTVGQRKGLGAFGKPMYVLNLNPEKNTVTVGDNIELFKDEIYCDDVSFVSEKRPESELKCEVKIRCAARPAKATFTLSGDTGKIVFLEPQRAAAPGQTAAIYIDDILIGGGTICNP